MKVLYNLPKKVVFCKRCVMSNQRPSSIPEFKHIKNRKGAKYLNLDDNQVCDACNTSDIKNKKINWEKREKLLLKLLDKFRKNNGEYDCIVPGSGGKDSIKQSHILKYKYGMNPLTITWSPILHTDYGYKNFRNWIEVGGFDNICFKQNGKTIKTLTKLAVENLFHPFQTFILGQKNYPVRLALKLNINLIFYGENEAEYGNPIADNVVSLRDKSFYIAKKLNNLYLAGVPVPKLISKHKLKLVDLKPYLPIEAKEFEQKKLEVHYLGYYLKWLPQEAYYYSVKHANFQPRPYRTQGTYSKYRSIDDKIDDLNYYCSFIKYGLGRCSHEASQEIRNKHITREEGKSLVKKFDGEFPDIYFDEVMDYLEIKKKDFFTLEDKFRSPHLWKKEKNKWKLRHTINGNGVDD